MQTNTRQAAFVAKYEALLNQLSADEAVTFADAVQSARERDPGSPWRAPR